jgi:hypothetical protein
MKAVWLTDIHLNFLKQKQLDAFLKTLSGEQADCFFISGDIAEADSIVKDLKQMSAALKRPIYFFWGIMIITAVRSQRSGVGLPTGFRNRTI